MPNIPVNFDRISFWLGFLAASLLWWIFYRLRPQFPHWRAQFSNTLQAIRQRNFASVESYLRRDTIHTAQASHAASPLFSLDEILIPPRLIAPPGGQEPVAQSGHHSIASQVIPYLPDWPELAAPFGVPLLTPLQALQSGRHLAFIGQPGSGKTVALAALAAQVARQDPAAGKYAAAIPVFLHVSDLEPVQESDRDPLDTLIEAVSAKAGVVYQAQIPRFLRSVLRDPARRIVVFIDGLDELPADRSAVLQSYLSGLTKAYPGLQVVVTASADFLDGLAKANFYPLAVAAWTQSQRVELLEKWSGLWNSTLLPEMRKQITIPEIDPLLMEHWLSAENDYSSPLEWTLRIWGAYAGDLSGSVVVATLDAYLSRFLPKAEMLVALQELALWMTKQGKASLPYQEMEKYLSSIKLVQPDEPAVHQSEAIAESESQSPSLQESASSLVQQRIPRKVRQKVIRTQGEEIVFALLAGGILIENANHIVRFGSIVFQAYLAAARITEEDSARIASAVDSALVVETLHYTAAVNEQPGWIYPFIEDSTAPLYRSLLMAARWLRDAPMRADWRSVMMRIMVNLLQHDATPLGIRARIIAAFYLSRDSSTPKLYKQLLSSKSSALRRAALFGCAALGSPQIMTDLLTMLTDSIPEVRYTACLALAAIREEPAINAVVEILLTGDEEIRQAAAEALAMIEPEGHTILREATEEQDLLTRRAAVFGLLQVRQPWARSLLERLAVEDAQWVVRNAAAQALEFLQDNRLAVPKPLPDPSDAGWLIAFASKFGMGILPGKPATDVLMAVLKSGSVEEQVAAIHYLREQPNDAIIAAIYHLLYNGPDEASEPALHALWWIAVTGTKLPEPVLQ